MKKTLVLILFGALAIHDALAAPGEITIANSYYTLISNAYTGLRVSSADQINAVLYYAPANTTDETLFVPLSPSVPVGLLGPLAGRYNGGNRTLPGFTEGDTVSIQMRAFETNYGHTYELAVAAAPKNGRRALVGKSAIAQIVLPDAVAPTPTTAACGGFFVNLAGGGAFLTVNDVVVSEGSNGTATVSFKISLLETQSQTVSVDFTTTDGTATTGSDYVATNGTVTFAPGETETFIAVDLIPDVPVEPDEVFYLDLSNGVNAIIARPRGNCTITEVRITGLRVDTTVSFNTVPNRRYLVERSTDSISWTPVAGATNVAGSGGIVTVIDQGNGSLVSTVYRASILPP